MKYLICGDCHGNWYELATHINATRERGIDFDAIIQVGDFGVYPGDMKPLLTWFDKFDIKVPFYFIDGNHEDHAYLFSAAENLRANGLDYMWRGTFTDVGICRIGWMGGALNVDRPQEFDGNNWWLNIPAPDEVESFADKINRSPVGVDLLITHSCPSGIGIKIKGSKSQIVKDGIEEFITRAGIETPPQDDIGDYFLRDLYSKIRPDKLPKYWVFGHFHNHHRAVIGKTTFQCVGLSNSLYGDDGRSYAPPRVYIYDTDKKELMG